MLQDITHPAIIFFQRGLTAIKAPQYEGEKIIELMDDWFNVLNDYKPDTSLLPFEAADDMPSTSLWTYDQLRTYLRNIAVPVGMSRIGIWYLIWQMRIHHPEYAPRTTYKYNAVHEISIAPRGQMKITALFCHGIGALLAGVSIVALVTMPWEKIREYPKRQLRLMSHYCSRPLGEDVRTKKEVYSMIEKMTNMGYEDDHIWNVIIGLRVGMPEIFEDGPDTHS